MPREAHAEWRPPKNRRDPVELILDSNRGRVPNLVPIRHGRMAQSPFAFYRGSAALMAADLATTPKSGLLVQACGDAHLMNFGGFATPERHVAFDINDLDETLPAPWEWDLKRLAASFAIAGRHLRLPETESARAARAAARSYRERMINYSSMRALEIWYESISVQDFIDAVAATQKRREEMQALLEKARQRSTPEILFPKLVEHVAAEPRIKDEPPLMFHPSAAQAPGLKTGYVEQLALYRESLPEHVRVLLDRYRLCDLALKVVGVGSVGTACGVLLFVAGDDDPLFLQFKEARASVLEPYAGESRHPNHGQRVVVGQRIMQSASDIFLGWFRAADGRDVYMRQLRDIKMSPVIDDWDGDLLQAYGRVCGWALAKAHARSGDPAKIAGYMGNGRAFDTAIAEFSWAYADQNERDYRAFVKAIREDRVKAIVESQD